MEDIQTSNFQALSKFAQQIKNDLAKNNGHVRMANVQVNYVWEHGSNAIETITYISLDKHPFASLMLIEEDWLISENFYMEFQTGYNKFSFNDENKTLVIENNASSKMGSYYRVEIKEL